jgi:hypothetical protein
MLKISLYLLLVLIITSCTTEKEIAKENTNEIRIENVIVKRKEIPRYPYAKKMVIARNHQKVLDIIETANTWEINLSDHYSNFEYGTLFREAFKSSDMEMIKILFSGYNNYPNNPIILNKIIDFNNLDLFKWYLLTSTADDNFTENLLYMPENFLVELSASGYNFPSTVRYKGGIKSISILYLLKLDLDFSDIRFLYDFCRNGHLEIVKLLINNYSLDYEQIDEHGRSSIFFTTIPRRHDDVSDYQVSVFDYLVNKKANLYVITTNGETLLHYATHGGNIEIVEKLLNIGLDPTIKDTQGNSALHTLSMNPMQFSYKIADLLITKGCSMKEENYDGKTPLNLIDEWLRKDSDYQNFIVKYRE